MGLGLHIDTSILSKEEYDKFANGECYLSNYEGFNFISKQEVDAEIDKLFTFYKEKGLINHCSYEKFENILRLKQWAMDDYVPEEYLEQENLYQYFQDNYNYFCDKEERYFTIDEWLNYKDGRENNIKRTINSRNINGQDVYCLIEAKVVYYFADGKFR